MTSRSNAVCGWLEALAACQHRRLLQSTGTVAGRNGFNVVALHGIINEPQRATIMALDGAPSASSGRHYGDHAGHHGQPKCLSAVSWLESRVWFPYLPFGGDHFLPGQRCRFRSLAGALSRQGVAMSRHCSERCSTRLIEATLCWGTPTTRRTFCCANCNVVESTVCSNNTVPGGAVRTFN